MGWRLRHVYDISTEALNAEVAGDRSDRLMRTRADRIVMDNSGSTNVGARTRSESKRLREVIVEFLALRMHEAVHESLQKSLTLRDIPCMFVLVVDGGQVYV